MSLHIDRACYKCSRINDNEIYINWKMPEEFDTPEEQEEQRQYIDDFYNKWICQICRANE